MKARSEPSDAAIESALRDSRQLRDAPEHVIQRALGVWSARAQTPEEPGLLRRLMAALSFDSGGASPLAFGMRSTGATMRQLLYTVEGRDVDLRVASGAQPHTYLLSGQVLGPDSSGTVTLETQAGGARVQVVLSELGEFQLPAVPAGTYRLTLDLADIGIDLPLLQIPQAT
jgi:hypothetical protein